jgi:hypothetical protein
MIITDALVESLISMPKSISNPSSRWRVEGRYKRREYDLMGPAGERFSIFLRQNVKPGMEDDFSAGIRFIALDGNAITLRRYNGPHDHLNRLERTRTGISSHIHLATERYYTAGLKPDGFAEATDRYISFETACQCLLSDCNVSIPETGNPSQGILSL